MGTGFGIRPDWIVTSDPDPWVGDARVLPTSSPAAVECPLPGNNWTPARVKYQHVAQPGRALPWGGRGRGIEARYADSTWPRRSAGAMWPDEEGNPGVAKQYRT